MDLAHRLSPRVRRHMSRGAELEMVRGPVAPPPAVLLSSNETAIAPETKVRITTDRGTCDGERSFRSSSLQEKTRKVALAKVRCSCGVNRLIGADKVTTDACLREPSADLLSTRLARERQKLTRSYWLTAHLLQTLTKFLPADSWRVSVYERITVSRAMPRDDDVAVRSVVLYPERFQLRKGS